MHHIERLEKQEIVVPACEHGDHVLLRQDKNKLAAFALCSIGHDKVIPHTKCTQPPLIPIFVLFERENSGANKGRKPPWKQLYLRLRCCRCLDPLLAHNLLALPAAAIQQELPDFCHIARPQFETPSGVDSAIGIFEPVVVRDAKGCEQIVLGKFVRAQP
jgi:hypothetical protein